MSLCNCKIALVLFYLLMRTYKPIYSHLPKSISDYGLPKDNLVKEKIDIIKCSE